MALSSLQAAEYAAEVYDKVKDRRQKKSLSSKQSTQFTLDYIRATIGYPKQEFDIGKINATVLIETEAGVEAYLQVIEGELIIAIAGTNSIKDQVFNTKHLFDSLWQGWKNKIKGNKQKDKANNFNFAHENFRGYELAYETLIGHLFYYLSHYEDLASQGAVTPISSATVVGHSAGGMVANYIAAAIAKKFRLDNPQFKTQLFSFGSPVTQESPFGSKLGKEVAKEWGIEVQRYVIANDLISQLLPTLLREEQYHTQVLPAIAIWKRPHQLKNFVNQLRAKKEKRQLYSL